MQLAEITVASDEPLAGTYNFGDYGIDTENPASPSTAITLKLKEPSLFPILDRPSPEKNAAIMVLAPGFHPTLTVTYKLINHDGGTVTRPKTYYNQELKAGKNKPVKFDLH
ncbi:MAG: hypothetical protein SOZ80_06055 [Prevotella sp.]|uniref:hypothetical protein n=1 Tax=Prevotella sp. TaxID=59823 RepID=UPI002A2D3147|nr:hypothetical protein [Prevotella sp.]MDD7318514.1 hypothetical protein [Prevotellaceae bacterium]MDY4020319.1 hypothetical protein [Prevotella sp.]